MKRVVMALNSVKRTTYQKKVGILIKLNDLGGVASAVNELTAP
ncbi:hypothetical protein [Bacillus sp. CDB3]|nr:hypothetical protein [Bacillus sp. CDB3]